MHQWIDLQAGFTQTKLSLAKKSVLNFFLIMSNKIIENQLKIRLWSRMHGKKISTSVEDRRVGNSE